MTFGVRLAFCASTRDFKKSFGCPTIGIVIVGHPVTPATGLSDQSAHVYLVQLLQLHAIWAKLYDASPRHHKRFSVDYGLKGRFSLGVFFGTQLTSIHFFYYTYHCPNPQFIRCTEYWTTRSSFASRNTSITRPNRTHPASSSKARSLSASH